MSKDNNPIRQVYWPKIWSYNDGEIESRIKKANRHSIRMVLIWAISIFILCTVYWGWSLDAFYWSWTGYAAVFLLGFWILFLSPFKNMKKQMTSREYVQKIVYEDPKKPSVFIKNHLEENKNEFFAFIYLWMMGVVFFIYLNDDVWRAMMPHQNFWINKLPTAIPIAITVGLFLSVIFAIIQGSTSPKSQRGKILKRSFMIVISLAILLLIYLAIFHVDSITDFFENYNNYSVRYPENPEENIWGDEREFWINWNAFFWIIGMILSAAIGIFFALVCSLYQNNLIRTEVDEVYGLVLERDVESLWEHKPHKERVIDEQKKRKKIKRIAAIELVSFFTLVLVAFWGLYFYVGDVIGDKTWQNIGIGILAIQVIWALFLSPIYHYNLEKDVLYTGPQNNKGYVWGDDRGIGSWKKFWEENRFKEKNKKTLIMINLLSVLGVLGFVIDKEGAALDIFDALGVGEIEAVGASSTLFAIFAFITLIYGITILQFSNQSDPELGWKKIYSLLFIIFLSGIILWGIPGIFYERGVDIATFYENFSLLSVWALFSPILVIGVLLLLMNILFFPIFIRYEDLYESIKDLIAIIIVGIVVLITFNYLCELFFAWGAGEEYMHHSWRREDPVELREDFQLGFFLVGVFGYHYWGWVQELLFLGYFCWLSWKIFPDKNSHHKWINATISAILFGLFHYDNMPLMIGTMLGGFFWASIFGERRNLWMLGLMHGFNGSLVDWIVPMSMTVGPGGL